MPSSYALIDVRDDKVTFLQGEQKTHAMRRNEINEASFAGLTRVSRRDDILVAKNMIAFLIRLPR